MYTVYVEQRDADILDQARAGAYTACRRAGCVDLLEDVAGELIVDYYEGRLPAMDKTKLYRRSMDIIRRLTKHHYSRRTRESNRAPVHMLEDYCIEPPAFELVDVARLDQRERTVIDLFYRQEWTQKEVSELLGVASSRVSQLNTQAIATIRRTMKLSKDGTTR